MGRPLHVYYDTRLAPITFDFGSYLVVADAERQARGLDSLSLHLHRPAFRNRTIREQTYDDDMKDWRFRHILLAIPSLLPSVSAVEWSRASPHQIQFPSFPLSYPPRSNNEASDSIPYLSNALNKYRDEAIDLRPYKAKDQAGLFAKKLCDVRGNRGLITISLRTSTQQLQRNSSLDSWYEVYKELSDQGFDVFVIPDFEDITGNRQHNNYDWRVLPAATFDLDLRLGLYSIAKLNLGVLNGVLVPLFHSKYPYLIFKPNVEEIHQTTRAWLKRVFGIEQGESFWWSGRGQRLSWSDDNDSEVILDSIQSIMDAGL